jgi:hypothetical protein
MATEIVVDARNTKFSSKETLYYKMIDKFFKQLGKENIQKMLDIIDGHSKVSLRLLDWFVTRYANKNKIAYDLAPGERFNVHISYKAQLKSYKKRYFDPFRRRKKFIYKQGDQSLETTIGQLNFFRWAFSNNIIKYVEDHYNSVLKAMIKSNKDDKIRKIEEDSETSSKVEEVEKVVKVKDNIKIQAEKKKVAATTVPSSNQIKITLSFD